MRKLYLNIILLLSCLVSGFLLAELLIRWLPVGSGYERMLLRKEFTMSTKTNPNWGWSFQPDADTIWDYTGRERQTININFRTIPIPGHPDYGFRDDGIDPDAKRSILVLGDSFTFGATVQLEDVWCEVLEKRNPGFDFINAATGGGVVKAYLEYQQIKNTIKHDTVIYALWLGNEFLDNSNIPSEFEATDNNLHQFPPPTVAQVISEKSKILWMAINAFHQLERLWVDRMPSNRSDKDDKYIPEPNEFWIDGIGNMIIKPRNDILLKYAGNLDGNTSILNGIEHTKEYLRRLHDAVLDNNSNFVVIMFPFKEQIYFDSIPDNLIEEKLDPQKPNRIIQDFCELHSITCIDIFDTIFENRNEKIFWDYDVHFTPTGQRIAALAIENYFNRIFVNQ